MKRPVFWAVLLGLAFIIISSSVFTVNERSFALVFKLGEWQRTETEPGLKFKLPTPLENVMFLDKRIHSIESRDAERIQTSEKKNLIIDSYVKWRISDPRLYYISFGNSTQAAQDRLGAQIRDALNAAVNVRTVRAVISFDRDVVMQEILANISTRAAPLGIEVVDVRLKRIEFSSEVSESVYSRMQAERKQEANSLRASGAAESERIRAGADREVSEILAQAQAEAEAVRGAGDATAAKIYADVYSTDPEFFSFFNSLNAYRSSFADKEDTIVVSPDSSFFKYFGNSTGELAE